MEEAAQKEEEALHRGVSENLNQLGHRESPQTVNPDDHSALGKIKQSVMEATGETVHILGAPADQLLRGEASHIEIKESKPWSQSLIDRAKRKFQALKEAA